MTLREPLALAMNWYLIQSGQFGYPQPEGTWREELYDLTAGCPTCEIGKRLRGPFRFRSEPKAKHSHFIGLNWIFDEVFVGDVVKAVLEEQRVTGVDFVRPLRHKTGEPLETIYHMRVDTVLPPALQIGALFMETCAVPKERAEFKFLAAIGSRLVKGPFCGAVKYNYPQGPEAAITLSRSAFDSAPDVVRMHEWFGSGGSAGRPILISQRLKDIIDQMAWRGLTFSPISMIDG